MSYVGDIALGATIDIKFCTVQSTGAPTTLSGSPVISAYPDNSTTQLTAGITLTADFDSVTGLNNCRVVATGGNGYLAGSNYTLVITTGTVNSVSAVGYVVGEFSIQARPPQIAATGATPALGVADAGTLQSATGTTAVLRSGASATDSIYNGHTLFIASGTGAGESRLVTGYVGASKTCTVDTWTTNPDNTSLYVLIATPPGSTAAPLPVNSIQLGSQTVTASGAITANANLGTTQPVNFTGTGASALAKSDMVDIAGTAVSTPATAGVLDVNVKNMNNVAATAITTIKAVQGLAVDGVVPTVTNLTNAATAGDLTATMKTSVGTAVAASAVASVTGNVGGNVTGSVGSVVGAVGSVTAGVTLAGPAGIKKNTAINGFVFPMTDSTTHAPATGLTVTAQRSLDKAAFANCANAVTEISAGWYWINLATTDTNGNTVALKFTATGADQLNLAFVTSP